MLQRFAVLLSTAALLGTVACAQSDPGITTSVKAKLAADDTVKAYQIDVDTSNHVVTLTGAVETAAAKDQAMMIARRTDGVRDVIDHLTVNPGAAATTGEVSETVNEAARKAREETREGIDKTKELGREAQTKTGEAADRTGAAITDAAVTTAVKAKFLADTAVSGLKIDVDTKDGVVTLNGTVSSKAEADHAVSVARGTDGVKRVINNLQIGR